MKEQENKHTSAFVEKKLQANESVLAHLEGWIGEMMGKGDDTQHNGQFILTNQRACFFRKGFFGEVLETIPLTKITSVETQSFLGHRVLRLHTSHDDLSFKTFESKELFDSVYRKLEEVRHAPRGDGSAAPIAPSESALDQLKKLGDLRNAGILTEDEFNTKKAALLSKI